MDVRRGSDVVATSHQLPSATSWVGRSPTLPPSPSPAAAASAPWAAWRRRHATIVAAMASGTSCGASRPRDSESSSSVICIERFDLFYLFNLFNLCNHLQQQQRPGSTHQLTATATILHAAAARCMTGQISHPSLVGWVLRWGPTARVACDLCAAVRRPDTGEWSRCVVGACGCPLAGQDATVAP